MFHQVEQVTIHQDVADYIQSLIQTTREHSEISTGVSSAAFLHLLQPYVHELSWKGESM